MAKHLGYFNHIFRLSQLHPHGQGMLPIESSLHAELFSWSLVSGILTTAIQPRTLQGADACVRSKKQQTSPEMLVHILFLKGDTNLTKEGSFSIHFDSNCKHILTFICDMHTKGYVTCTQKDMCHTHKRICVMHTKGYVSCTQKDM